LLFGSRNLQAHQAAAKSWQFVSKSPGSYCPAIFCVSGEFLFSLAGGVLSDPRTSRPREVSDDGPLSVGVTKIHPVGTAKIQCCQDSIDSEDSFMA